MSEQDYAYRSTDPAVIEVYNKWVYDWKETAAARIELIESVGRSLKIAPNGFGIGTRVVGFERFESDMDGDLLGTLVCEVGALIVSTKRGQHKGSVIPNLRRKSGKEFAEYLRAFDAPELELPGMPMFHLGALYINRPAIWPCDDTLYALYGCEVEVGPQWEPIPLSTYYLAKERCDAEHEAESNG